MRDDLERQKAELNALKTTLAEANYDYYVKNQPKLTDSDL
jgi:NAD-dependent DNA ligase